METTIAIIKENAPFAVMLLMAVLYLERDHDEIREDLAEHGERIARVEALVESIGGRLVRVETLVDEILSAAKPWIQIRGLAGHPCQSWS